MSNPILNQDRFSVDDGRVREAVVVNDSHGNDYVGGSIYSDDIMTVNGTVNKIFMLFACLFAGVMMSLYFLLNQNPLAIVLMFAGGVVGSILVLIACFRVDTAKYLAAPYALCEGLFVGGVSCLFEYVYKGVVIQAIASTMVVLLVMLLLYKARIINYTKRMGAVLFTGVLSISAIYLIDFIASFFGRRIPLINGSGPVGILFSLVVIGFASFSLIRDFFFIEESSKRMLPKDYEWFGAMGLMITLVWLYVEFLKLFAKLNSRR